MRFWLMRTFETEYPSEILLFDPLQAEVELARRWLQDRTDLVEKSQKVWRFGRSFVLLYFFLLLAGVSALSATVFWTDPRRESATLAAAYSQLSSEQGQGVVFVTSLFYDLEFCATVALLLVLQAFVPLAVLLVLGASSNDNVDRHWRMFKAQAARLAAARNTAPGQRAKVTAAHAEMCNMYIAGSGNVAELLRVMDIPIDKSWLAGLSTVLGGVVLGLVQSHLSEPVTLESVVEH